MKPFSLFALLSTLAINVIGQTMDYTNYYNGTSPLTDISDLKTNNDFDQNELSAEQIDKRLSRLILSSKNYDNDELDIPYNSKRLIYIGRKHPKDTFKLNQDAFSNRLLHIDKELEIYSYDGVYIFLSSKNSQNILNLFFTLRALSVIKFRYPEAYKLIKQNQSRNATSFVDPNHKPPSFNKTTSVISFDQSPEYIAASTSDMVYANAPSLFIDGFGYYENITTVVTSIDSENILGNTEYGSKRIYNLSNAADNYFSYMRDGLIETIIHEFIHNYISTNANVDKKAFFINEMRFNSIDNLFSRDVEETIVINTSLKYFNDKGGISTTVLNYYEEILKTKEIIITSYFSNKINLERYYALKALTNKYSANTKEIYSLDILD